MARKKLVRPEVAAHKEYLEGVAKNLAMKLYGPEGMPWGTTFDELEELVVQLGQTISRELANQVLRKQAAKPVPPEAHRCPTCHQPSEEEPSEPRIVTMGVGDAEWSEPYRHCSHCRRSFFPSVAKLGD